MCRKNDYESISMKERRLSFTSINTIAGCMPDFVNLDNPTITVVMTFQKRPPKLDLLTEAVEEILHYKRLSSVPTQASGNLKKWKFENLDKELDPRRMIRILDINCDTTEEWAKIVGEQRQVSLRRKDLPWWEFVLMNNSGEGVHLLLFRIDHGLADGLSVGKVFTKIIKRIDGSTIHSLLPPTMMSNKSKSRRNWFALLMSLPRSLFVISTSVVGREDDRTHFSKDAVGVNLVDKRNQDVIIFPPFPIDIIKKLKDKAGVSLNDVLLAVWSQTAEDYCKLHDCPILKKRGENVLNRCMMTYGFPEKSNDYENAIGNRWVPLAVRLPFSGTTVTEKLQQVSSATRSLKTSLLPILQLFLQNTILKILPFPLTRHIVHRAYSKISISFTSVPGPQEKVSIAGEPIDSCMFFACHIHPVLSFLSYNGQIYTTLLLKKDTFDDSHMIPKCFMRALITLCNEMKVDVPNSMIEHCS